MRAHTLLTQGSEHSAVQRGHHGPVAGIIQHDSTLWPPLWVVPIIWLINQHSRCPIGSSVIWEFEVAEAKNAHDIKLNLQSTQVSDGLQLQTSENTSRRQMK